MECSQRPLGLPREQGGDGLATCWDALGRGRSCLDVGRWAPSFIVHAFFLKFIYLFVVLSLCCCMWAFSYCSTQAQLPCGMWNLPRPGRFMSPALAGGLLTTEPPRTSPLSF